MTSITDQIIAALNTDRAFDNGLSRKDAALTAPNVVTFTYPAPVVSGACVGTLTIAADGSIFDDTSDNVHPNVASFLADLESMMEV